MVESPLGPKHYPEVDRFNTYYQGVIDGSELILDKVRGRKHFVVKESGIGHNGFLVIYERTAAGVKTCEEGLRPNNGRCVRHAFACGGVHPSKGPNVQRNIECGSDLLPMVRRVV